MKFEQSKDIAAPLDFTYRQLTNFNQLQRIASRRNTRVTRLDDRTEPGPGMRWRAEFRLRGRDREVEVTLDELVPQERIGFLFEGRETRGSVMIALSALSPAATRMNSTIVVEGRRLGMWFLLQSLRLAHGRVARRLDDSAGRLATWIGNRW